MKKKIVSEETKSKIEAEVKVKAKWVRKHISKQTNKHAKQEIK